MELYVDLLLPSGTTIRAEVDTGSSDLILHRRYMEELGVGPDRPNVTKREGRDETGQPYVRYFSPVRGRVAIAAAPSVGQNDPRVMFQEIIHDALVGDSFLRSYDVTYDLDHSRILFADPGEPLDVPPTFLGGTFFEGVRGTRGFPVFSHSIYHDNI